MEKTHLLAAEVMAILGINRATLYAYVSRGLIRSERHPQQRCNQYRAADIMQLKQRQEWRHHPQKITEKALYWGEPLLDTAISLVQDGQLYYRGQDVTRLAQERTFEEVISWLWMGNWELAWPSLPPLAVSIWQRLNNSSLDIYEQMQALLPWLAHDDLRAYDHRPPQVIQTGVKILHGLGALLLHQPNWHGSLAANLQRYWVPHQLLAQKWFNQALILCADHELNISTFTARCVASAGATPYAVIQAALAAFQGSRHGGHTLRLEALLADCQTPEQVQAVLKARLQRGESLPTLSHPFYPQGDPRGKTLLTTLHTDLPQAPELAIAHALLQSDIGQQTPVPTLDLALVILCRMLKLPPGSALLLFTLGRCVGWIAHAIEQYSENRLIRPRARYVGASAFHLAMPNGSDIHAH